MLTGNRGPSPIILRRELARQSGQFSPPTTYMGNPQNSNGLQSALFDPLKQVQNQYGNLRTVDRYYNRSINCQTLRRVSSKAWIINACIGNTIRKIEPFLKPSTDRNIRGFVVLKRGEDISKASGKKSAERETIEKFLLHTGFVDDPDRDDDFIKYCTKIIRDLLEIDQIATEIQYTNARKPCAFWAVDAATIERIVPGQENPYKIKYAQVIDYIPYAWYTKDQLIFDFQNPRTDIDYSFYGYSYVEQAIDLITSVINTFTYNAGFFTENKLPRGMLLIDGDADQETVEMMEDYICDIMSGNPSSQWRIPIIPSGIKKGEGGGIRWQSLTGTNKEMEYQNWMEFLTSGVLTLFGTSMDDIGLQINKSQPMVERDAKPKIEAGKSAILGHTLTFLQSYLNKIIEKINPNYSLEFVGYERDDPEQILNIDKSEVESYKTLNEKRQEKGLKPLDLSEIKNPADIPLSPQAVQLFQHAQQGGMMGGMGDFGGEEGGMEGEAPEGDGAPNTDNEAWDALEAESGGEPQEGTEKSLARSGDVIRIEI
ncbi:phage portal protein [Treponema sp. R6D11]